VLDRHVRAALAAGIAAGDEDVARRSLPRDPVARSFARRRLERALIDAALACDGAGLARPPAAHVLRLAALAAAGRAAAGPSAGDEAAVAAAYAALPEVTAPRVPVWTIAAALVSLALVGGAVLYVMTLPGAASRTYARPLPPPTAAAFREGGVPLRDAALDALLSEQLTKLVVEAGRIRRDPAAGSGGLVGPLRDAAPIAAHGAPLARAWRDMLDVFARSVEAARRTEGPAQRERDELREAVRELSQRFAEVGLGYFLEGRFKSGFVYVQAYRVEQVVFVAAGGKPRRVLSLRRLDRLSTSYAALGLHNEGIGDPLLMLDQIDENVASTVLPVLAKDAPYPLADRAWMATPAGKALAAQIGGVIRAELAAALGADAAAVERIAALLVERAGLIEEWRDALERKQIRFVATDDLFLPQGLLDQLEGVVSTYQRKQVKGIEAELAQLEAPRIHARVHDLVAASVRRHEAQHGFDYDRETELRYPQVLSAMLGSSNREGEEVSIVRSARSELAAWLSQVANDPVTPHASLWHLARWVFDHDQRGTSYFYAGIVVIEGLARRLGAQVEGRTFRRGLDRERLAELAKLIASQPGAALRTAAAGLWMDLYGEPVTPIVDAPAAG
jgi:hypothetical protein